MMGQQLPIPGHVSLVLEAFQLILLVLAIILLLKSTTLQLLSLLPWIATQQKF